VENFCHTRLFPAFPAVAAVPWLPQILLLGLSLLAAIAGYHLIEKPAPKLAAALLERIFSAIRRLAADVSVLQVVRSRGCAVVVAVFLMGPVMHGVALRNRALMMNGGFAAGAGWGDLHDTPDEIGPKDARWQDEQDGDNNFLFPRAIDDGRSSFEGHA
jgi:hypothetical protein